MSQVVYIAISIGIIMFTSLSGVIFIQKYLKRTIEKNMAILVSFSAGIFLITSMFLSHEALELTNTTTGIIIIVIGFILFLLGQKLIPESHHHPCVLPFFFL